jgi:hypothetical protein
VDLLESKTDEKVLGYSRGANKFSFGVKISIDVWNLLWANDFITAIFQRQNFEGSLKNIATEKVGEKDSPAIQ